MCIGKEEYHKNRLKVFNAWKNREINLDTVMRLLWELEQEHKTLNAGINKCKKNQWSFFDE